jgi:hypothetical protein
MKAAIAAPYAGMTQTGSKGVISAARHARHPWPKAYHRHPGAVVQALAGHIPFFGGPRYEMAKRVHFVGVKLMRVTLAAIVATIL